MPQILGQQPGGFDVQFDDGTVGFMPDYLASGLVGQGMGLEQPEIPEQLPPEPPTEALPNAPAEALAPTNPAQTVGSQLASGAQLPPGTKSVSVNGTAPFAPVQTSTQGFGLPPPRLHVHSWTVKPPSVPQGQLPSHKPTRKPRTRSPATRKPSKTD